VLAEYNRLKQVARGKKVPTRTPPAPAQMVVKQAAPATPAPKAEEPEVVAPQAPALANL